MNTIAKEIRKLPMPCIIGLPVIMIALLLIKFEDAEPFDLLWRELLIVFGYIAAIIDIKTKRVPNKLVITMLVVWLFIMTAMMLIDIDRAVVFLTDSALGFALSGGVFMTVYLISRKGLGGGDVKFAAASGLYLGVGGILPAIFIGTVLAALIGGILILTKKIKRKDPIPLIPFLFAGMLITIFLS